LDNEAPFVNIVDDDALVLRSLGRVLRSAGFAVRTYPSSQDFLSQAGKGEPGCLVLDLRMPGLDGLELQAQLARLGNECPVVFLSGNADIPQSVKAMKAGAVDFLTKPVDCEQLLAAVRTALGNDQRARAERETRADVAGRVAALTPRARGARRRGRGQAEQADRGRARHRGEDGEGAPCARDEEDARGLARRASSSCAA